MDAALHGKMPALMVSIDARVKRQAAAVAATQAAIVELQEAIAVIDKEQHELDLDAARTENAPKDAPKDAARKR